MVSARMYGRRMQLALHTMIDILGRSRMSNNGFITIQRKITDWRWWGNETAMALWLYILVNANWKDGWWDRGQEVVKRGEFITSQLKIADELHLNRRTVTKYLKLFAEEGQIELKVDNRKTLIKVINYAKYQDVPNDDAQLTAQLNAQVNAQHSTQQHAQLTAQQSTHNRTIINQNKPYEPVNNNRHPFKPPTLEEVRAYCRERNNNVDAERFIDYYSANGWVQGKGKPIKDWKACIRTWEKNSTTTKGNTSKPASWPDEPPTKPEDYGEFQNW
jgi:hypothetical protein